LDHTQRRRQLGKIAREAFVVDLLMLDDAASSPVFNAKECL
jgi:hypothetical protein